jgi:hypothetical protein
MRAAQDIPAQPLPRITYAPRGDAAPGDEIAALSNVFKFVLDCHSKREATRPRSSDDAKERSKNVSSATQNYTT